MMEEASPSYYTILGVSSESSFEEIKRAYRKLAMQWHPDKWMKTPSLLNEAKRRFQKIQEAYSVLSDQKKRTLYDVGLYEPEEEEEDEDEGFSGFVQELVSIMAQDRREGKSYTMEDLQAMFTEMVQGFQQSSWYSSPAIFEDPGRSKRARCDPDSLVSPAASHFTVSGCGMCGASSYCN